MCWAICYYFCLWWATSMAWACVVRCPNVAYVKGMVSITLCCPIKGYQLHGKYFCPAIKKFVPALLLIFTIFTTTATTSSLFGILYLVIAVVRWGLDTWKLEVWQGRLAGSHAWYQLLNTGYTLGGGGGIGYGLWPDQMTDQTCSTMPAL